MWQSARYRRAEARKASLDREIDRIPEQDLRSFHEALSGKTKDPDTFATLAWCMVGIQYIYLNHPKRTLLVILAYAIGALTLTAGIGLVIIIATLIHELAQCIESQAIVMEHNNRVKEALLERYRADRQVLATRL